MWVCQMCRICSDKKNQCKECWIFHTMYKMQGYVHTNTHLCPPNHVCVSVCVWAFIKAATVVVASWGIEINECNQKQTASQARAINTSNASRAAGLLGQAWLEPKRWRIKMQPQAKSTAFLHTADVHGGMALGAWHRHASANWPLGQLDPIRADNLLAAFR